MGTLYIHDECLLLSRYERFARYLGDDVWPDLFSKQPTCFSHFHFPRRRRHHCVFSGGDHGDIGSGDEASRRRRPIRQRVVSLSLFMPWGGGASDVQVTSALHKPTASAQSSHGGAHFHRPKMNVVGSRPVGTTTTHECTPPGSSCFSLPQHGSLSHYYTTHTPSRTQPSRPTTSSSLCPATTRRRVYPRSNTWTMPAHRLQKTCG